MLNECREYRPRLIEVARGTASPEDRASVMAHLELCPACYRALDDQCALSTAIDGLAGEAVPVMKLVEAKVLAEFDRVLARRRIARWIPVAGLAAAALLGVVWVEHRPAVVRPRAGESATVASAILPAPQMARPSAAAAQIVRVGHKKTRNPSADDNQPFLPIPYTVPLGPEERTTVVRMEIPVAALVAAGFDVPALDPGALVLADVLIGQDGRARAIRPVRVAAGK